VADAASVRVDAGSIRHGPKAARRSSSLVYRHPSPVAEFVRILHDLVARQNSHEFCYAQHAA